MSKPKLHIICGGCGCNSKLQWIYVPEVVTLLGKTEITFREAEVQIRCYNCLATYSLNDLAAPLPPASVVD